MAEKIKAIAIVNGMLTKVCAIAYALTLQHDGKFKLRVEKF